MGNYFRECKQEMKKVSWPKKSEVVSSTRVVLVSTIISAVLLGAVDYFVLWGLSFLY